MVTIKRHLIPLFFGVLIAMSSVYRCAASKTFFTPRSMQSDISVFNATSTLFNNSVDPAERFSVSATTFYQQSTNFRDLARYFMLGGKDELVIKGTNAAGDRDISASWLQIAGINEAGDKEHFPSTQGIDSQLEELYFNKFESKIKMRPNFKRFGTVIRLFKSFDYSHRFWLDVAFPVMQVQTDLNLSEYDVLGDATTRELISRFTITNVGTGDIVRTEPINNAAMLNATEGLNNPFWKYGKFKSGCQKLAGLADVTVKLGYAAIKREDVTWNLHATGVIPTGYKPRSEFVFEPLVGNGQHFGLGFGTNFDWGVYQGDAFDVNVYSSLDYAYLFRNHQMRSFDLMPNGEWSRYLLVFFPNAGPNNVAVPGINVFTDRMHVTPGSEIQWTSDINFNVDRWAFHLGYNLWWRNKEHVKLAQPWDKQVAIMHFPQKEDAIFTFGSFSQAKISDHFIGEPNPANLGIAGNNPLPIGDDALGPVAPVLVKQEDLNINSAAHPSVTGHKIYGVIGYAMPWAGLPIELSVGGSYQVNDSVKTVQDWGVWLQCSLPV